MARRKKKHKLIKYILLLVILGAICYYFLGNKKIEKYIPKPVIKKIKIVDENSKTRPIAVMINNNHAAWPHAGLSDAYITYEIIAEGGITRLMAIFKDKDTTKIGSVRSARPYYLDYALENDAIYVHYGWSEDAKRDIEELNVDNINGLTDNVFWRDKTLNRAYEHTAFTSMEKIKDFSSNKGYNRNTNKKLLLKYSADEIDLGEDAQIANNIYINYSNYHNVSYEYDSINKVYKRSMSNTPHVDMESGQQYTYKNIIIAIIKNESYDSYGRQKLYNIGFGDGYYITNGRSIPITWSKSSRNSQTIYKNLDDEEIKVNDGNTFIQIVPLGEKINIE